MAYDGWPRGAGDGGEPCSPASPPFPQDLRRHRRRHSLCALLSSPGATRFAPRSKDYWCHPFVRLYFGGVYIALEHIILYRDIAQ